MKYSLMAAVIALFLVSCGLQTSNQTGMASQAPTATKPIQTPQPTLTENQTMDQIEREVTTIRGLQPTQAVVRSLLNTSELHEKVISDFFSDYTKEDASDDVAELNLVGLLPKEFDLYQFYIDLYSEQVAGYYDPKTKEMYVVADQKFGGIEQLTYSHEYDHVLQDQTYDMRNGLMVNDEYCKTHTEYCAAVTALVEGDASLLEQQWFLSYGTQELYNDINEFYANYESPVYDSAPAYMQQDFLFPYMQGLEFVNSLYHSGGWASVDSAYKNPPVDTEQILHPEGYPQDTPIDVPLPDYTSLLGGGWRESTRNVMGEWYWYLILGYGYDPSYRLDQDTASTASTGWGGDSYLIYRNDTTGESALYARTKWDSTRDAIEFWSALQQYGELRWGQADSVSATRVIWQDTSDGCVLVSKDSNDILWIIAPAQSIADIFLNQ
jgi:hypothetical protein